MNWHRASRRSWLWALALLLLGCRAQPTAGSEPGGEPSAARAELVIFAAASLRDAFGSLKREFLEAHPGVELRFNFAGTQELRTQLEHGAPADVFASADQRHMATLREGAKVQEPVVFARNEPVIVLARERQGKVRGLAELPALDRLVVGAPEVPIGRYTAQLLSNASAALGPGFAAVFEQKVVSRELDVRQVLNKVALGEADAGIVYRSDAQHARGAVEVVTIPAQLNVIAEYPIAVTSTAAHPTLAEAWIQLVLSPAGQELLTRAGFLSPTVVAGL